MQVVNRSFEPTPGWRSGHLQTVRSRVLPRRLPLARYGSERGVLVDVDDGTGDRLAVRLHRARYARRPGVLVVLIHGLGGTTESDYVRASALGMLRAGWNVARVDLRGAGRSGETSSLMYHAGRTEDLRAVLRALAEQPEAQSEGQPRLVVMGFSLGGSTTLKLLGEPHDLPPVAGVAVSPPLDLSAGSEHLTHMMFGLYERFLMRGLRRDSLRTMPDGTPAVTPAERRAILAARRIVEFDDAITARRNGWRDAAEYYSVNSAAQFLDRIRTPTLLVHSADDPMIPFGPYLAVDWDAIEAHGYVHRAITPHGGHVGFHERGNPLPWFVGAAVQFVSHAVP